MSYLPSFNELTKAASELTNKSDKFKETTSKLAEEAQTYSTVFTELKTKLYERISHSASGADGLDPRDLISDASKKAGKNIADFYRVLGGFFGTLHVNGYIREHPQEAMEKLEGESRRMFYIKVELDKSTYFLNALPEHLERISSLELFRENP